MRLLGVSIKENPFYCSYADECWIVLARAIMSSYSDKYAYQIPTTAFSQEEYYHQDRKLFLPVRKSILRNVMNGPLRSIVDIHAVYSGFEQKRLAYKRSMMITWKDDKIDIDELIGRQ